MILARRRRSGVLFRPQGVERFLPQYLQARDHADDQHQDACERDAGERCAGRGDPRDVQELSRNAPRKDAGTRRGERPEPPAVEADLGAYLLRKFRELKRVSVRIDRNRAFVKGYGEFIVVQTEFEVIAKLVPVDGTKLMLADAKVFFGDLVAAEDVKRLVLDTLNPIVDLDRDLKLYGAVQVEGLSLENGVLEAWGKTKIPDRPKTLPASDSPLPFPPALQTPSRPSRPCSTPS